MAYDRTAQLEAGDHTRCPEYRGPATAVSFLSSGLRFPEELGPSSEFPGQDYGGTGMPRIGAIPPLLPPEMRARERAECERRNLLRQQVETAALSAARDAITAQNLSAQVFSDVDRAVERAVAAAPEPAAPEPEEVPAP